MVDINPFSNEAGQRLIRASAISEYDKSSGSSRPWALRNGDVYQAVFHRYLRSGSEGSERGGRNAFCDLAAVALRTNPPGRRRTDQEERVMQKERQPSAAARRTRAGARLLRVIAMNRTRTDDAAVLLYYILFK
jgi:hypothetical protein